MRWHDLEIANAGPAFTPFAFRVEAEDRPAGPPPLRVELAAVYRMRVVCVDRALLWGHAASDHFGWWRLAADAPRVAPVPAS